MVEYPRGSEWRIWDLHVHTPASNGFVGSFDQVITQINNSDCALVGINDYCTISGYKTLLSGRSEINKALLPVVELRMHNVIGDRRSKSSPVRINFHIVFNPDIDDLTKVEDFLKSLSFKDTSGKDRFVSSVYDDKEQLLKVSLDYFGVLDSLQKNADLAGNYLVILPYEGYGGIDGIDSSNSFIKPAMINRADLLMSAQKSEIDFFLWRDPKFTEEHYRKSLIKPMACIKGSDSHHHDYPIGKLPGSDSTPGDKSCWIKADPTFLGLRQVVNEPEDRVFIGYTPPALSEIANKKTKYIDAISIKKIDSHDFNENWFDCDLVINPGLVSIIGNKGSGKSALADTIALLANSGNWEDFSFLNEDKFLHPKSGKGHHFEAFLTWRSGGKSKTLPLDFKPDKLDYEYVKYLPQKYLEKICTELNTGERTRFDDELEAVVFSHVALDERLGARNLQELLQLRSEARGQNASFLEAKLKAINKQIADIEEQVKPSRISTIQEELEDLNRQFTTLKKGEPKEVIPIEDDPSKQEARKAAVSMINNISNEINELKQTIEGEETHLGAIRKNLNEIGRLEAILARLTEALQQARVDWKALGQGAAIDFDKVVQLRTDDTLLKQAKLNFELDIAKIEGNLSSQDKQGLKAKLKAKEEQLEKLKDSLEVPLREYQAYRQAFLDWQNRLKKLTGDSQTPGTIEYLKAILENANQLEIQRRQLFDERDDKIRLLYKEISGLAEDYRNLYAPIKEFVSGFSADPKIALELEVSIVDRGFVETLSEYLNFGRKGFYYGRDEGEKKLRDMIAKVDLNNEDEVIDLIHAFLRTVTLDKDNVAKDRTISDYLKDKKPAEQLYNYLTTLGYLEPSYKLTWEGVPLGQLSPGERGTVLLVFYLLIDKSDNPLIIDQPEENLDNETVYLVLCKCIKYAKTKRQIIVVTHNPNLAVVCDSEQVIHANIDKADGNRITYQSGSIENPEINKLLVKVLEGTRPAFDNRDSKYKLVMHSGSLRNI